MTANDEPPQEDPIDRVFDLLDDFERMLADLRGLAEQMKEDDE